MIQDAVNWCERWVKRRRKASDDLKYAPYYGSHPLRPLMKASALPSISVTIQRFADGTYAAHRQLFDGAGSAVGLSRGDLTGALRFLLDQLETPNG